MKNKNKNKDHTCRFVYIKSDKEFICKERHCFKKNTIEKKLNIINKKKLNNNNYKKTNWGIHDWNFNNYFARTYFFSNWKMRREKIKEERHYLISNIKNLSELERAESL